MTAALSFESQPHKGEMFIPDMLPCMGASGRSPSSGSITSQITIVGAGSLAQSLAPALRAAGYSINEIVSRPNAKSMKKARSLARDVGASAATTSTTKLAAEIVWFCVPDREISTAATSLAKAADWNGKLAFHSSGALSSDVMSALRAEGAALASLHPLMTFVADSRPSLVNVPFAIEGDAIAVPAARAIVSELSAIPFGICESDKEAYHAWGMFVSPLLTALLTMAERVAEAAHIEARDARKRMLPILKQTLTNYESLGAGRSFSGPIARGDVETVKKHLQSLEGMPLAREVYTALAKVGLQYLPAKNHAVVEKALVESTRKRAKIKSEPGKGKTVAGNPSRRGSASSKN